ncbi:MAG: DUF2059 domain-containing protein [Daejeonella sp.]
MKKLFLLLLFTGFFVSSYSQPSSKADNIRVILESTGVIDQSMAVMKNSLNSYLSSGSKMQQSVCVDISKELNVNSLIEMIIPIYDKYYSEKEIRRLAEFYVNPTAKEKMYVSPKLTAESIVAGQEWAKTGAKKIMLKLQNEKFEEDLKQ